jgi:uridine kinase
MSWVRARVIVLAGPSGAGKSRLAARLGLPVLRLDDFYKSGGDPTLPRIAAGANAGLVDWDDPGSWLREEALAAIDRLCSTGEAEVPAYDIARDGRYGSHVLDLGGAPYFLAEGIFAQEVVPWCRERDGLAGAYCLRQHPVVTFWRRLTRDLREHRKPPLVLVRRGLALMRDQRRVVGHAVDLGCVPVSPDEAYAQISALVRAAPADAEAERDA